MGVNREFASHFRLALQALGLSRARAASLLQVDKSLVGRWAAGSVRPSEHNLEAITRLIADRVPAFSMLDWNRNAGSFAAVLGVDPRLASASDPAVEPIGLPAGCLAQARADTARKGAAYHGFWRSIRPSVIMPGTIFHDYGMVRAAANGLLEVRMGSSGIVFDGHAHVAEGNFFAALSDNIGCTPLFFVFRGVPLSKAVLLDGLLVFAAFDAARTPAAIPLVLERIGDLSGDRDADDEHCQALLRRESVSPPGEVAEDIVKHLFRDAGPAAAATGGPLFLTAPGLFSRGASPSGELEG
jgi:transcriptional regulator with XRE-family HTH domain